MNSTNFEDDAFFAHVRRVLGRVNFLRDAMAAYFAMRDPATPAWAKAVILAALVYFLSPLDAIPDLTPLIGYGDDATVIAAAIRTASAFITEEHYRMADRWFNGRGAYA